ncbi:unnamed protein product [Heligmosomoides polygyrus]|uniref:Uncharacterized protein n=1 Tax=Heligmosomoides polygyrus TaxID=6339 RepID=A0A183GHK0_HELPZ|nr:unnamed protein product [Heligmosomoides polygyrus]
MESFLKPTEEAIMNRDPSTEARCPYGTLARQLKMPREHVDDKEALTKQPEERVNEFNGRLERLDKEKEVQAKELQKK